MNTAAVEARTALIRRARHHITKISHPGLTRVGVHVLAGMALDDIDAALAIDAKTRKAGRPGDGETR